MKERLQQLLSETGESIDYLRSDIRNLSRYMAELEELVEVYRAFALDVRLSVPTDKAKRRKILKKTQKVVGPQPVNQPEPDSGRAKSIHFFGKLSTQTDASKARQSSR